MFDPHRLDIADEEDTSTGYRIELATLADIILHQEDDDSEDDAD